MYLECDDRCIRIYNVCIQEKKLIFKELTEFKESLPKILGPLKAEK